MKKKKLLPKVFMWLFIGLLITFISGFFVSENPKLFSIIYDQNMHWIFVVAEVVIALVLTFKIESLKKKTALVLYIGYALLTGLTISFVFTAYKISSIIIIFLITSILFAIFALIGKITKIDLSKIGIYLFMGFISIIILELINIFLLNNTLNIITCIIGIIIFLIYIAYDIQRMLYYYILDDVDESSYPILFAFNLYIDFLNVFLDLLRLLGDSSD